MATYRAELIAEWFLRHDLMIREQEGGGISNLKLQKLLYYAQSAHLALCDGEPLFPEPIFAWKHGPVVRSIYEKYKDNHSDFLLPDCEVDLNCISPDDREILSDVYSTFGQYDAWKLRDMTHSEDPWLTTRANEIIAPAKMQKYFADHYLSS